MSVVFHRVSHVAGLAPWKGDKPTPSDIELPLAEYNPLCETDTEMATLRFGELFPIRKLSINIRRGGFWHV